MDATDVFSGLTISAGRGSRTPKTRRSADFESAAYLCIVMIINSLYCTRRESVQANVSVLKVFHGSCRKEEARGTRSFRAFFYLTGQSGAKSSLLRLPMHSCQFHNFTQCTCLQISPRRCQAFRGTSFMWQSRAKVS